MKEIISLSFGKHSNYIATHFWNAQDETFKFQPQTEEEKENQVDNDFQESTHVAY